MSPLRLKLRFQLALIVSSSTKQLLTSLFFLTNIFYPLNNERRDRVNKQNICFYFTNKSGNGNLSNILYYYGYNKERKIYAIINVNFKNDAEEVLLGLCSLYSNIVLDLKQDCNQDFFSTYFGPTFFFFSQTNFFTTVFKVIIFRSKHHSP